MDGGVKLYLLQFVDSRHAWIWAALYRQAPYDKQTTRIVDEEIMTVACPTPPPASGRGRMADSLQGCKSANRILRGPTRPWRSSVHPIIVLLSPFNRPCPWASTF